MIAIVGGKTTEHYRFNRGSYGLADMPIIFTTLKNTAPAWQDDVIIVTRGSIDKHKKELDEVLGLLEKQGYKASFKNIPIYFAMNDKKSSLETEAEPFSKSDLKAETIGERSFRNVQKLCRVRVGISKNSIEH